MIAIDLLIVILYLVFTLTHGWWFYKQANTASHFMAGAGNIPAWAAGFSVLGTFLSSVTFLAYPGRGCAENWNLMVFALTLPIGALFAHFFFIPFYRKLGVISIFGYLEDRFGKGARVYGNLCMFLAQLGRAGFTLYLVSGAMISIVGLGGDAEILSEAQWILITLLVLGIFVTGYCLLGGIEAVIWTDVVQVIILIGGALMCLVLLVAGTQGGVAGTLESAWNAGKFSLGPWNGQTGQSGSLFDLSLVTNTFLVTFLFGTFENLKNYNFEMVYVQRYATVSSVRAARRSTWLSVGMYIALTALFLMIGTALYGYFHQSPELEARLRAISSSDKIFPNFIGSLPVGVRGIMLVAILAAGISTVDSSFNVIATIYYSDLWKRYFRKASPTENSPNDEARILRFSTFVIGGLTIAFAMTCINKKGILDQIWAFAGLTGSGLVGLFLIGLLVPRSRPRDAWLSILIASPLTLFFALWSDTSYSGWLMEYGLPACPLHKTLTLPIGVSLHFLVGLLASFLPRMSSDESPEAAQARYNLTIFGYKALAARGSEMAPESDVTPAGATGDPT